MKTDYAGRALTIQCTYCLALPGEICVTLNDITRKIYKLHRVRKDASDSLKLSTNPSINPESIFSFQNPKEGDFRVWWIPQIPMKPFYIRVKNVDEAIKLFSILAEYDRFQYYNKIKPDYSNAGGLQIYAGDKWEEWHNLDEMDMMVENKIKDAESHKGI